jgi:sialic acid synthase SpsE
MALGVAEKRVLASEQETRSRLRKSLVSARELSAGTVLTAADVTTKRPGSGIAPGEMPNVMGRTVSRDVAADTLLSWDDLT